MSDHHRRIEASRSTRAARRGVAAALVGVTLLGAACSSTSSTDGSATTASPGTQPSSSTGGSTPGTDPDAAPMTFPSEAALQAAFEEEAGALFTPGAVMMLKTPAGTSTFTYGTRDHEGTTPISADDHFRIGSVTKTWTGTAILQLVQEGKIAVEDPVSKYRDDVPNGENITIAQMLSMTSGLANYTADPAFNAVQDAEPQKAWTQQELLDIAFTLPPEFPPGEGFLYSNTNTVLLGLIAEELDGKPLAEIIEDRILTPLGMSSSSFPAITDSTLPTPFADGYMFGTNVSTIDGAKLPPEELAAAEAGTLQPNSYTDFNPSWGWAAGSGISTVGDLLVYAQALTGDDRALLDDELNAGRLDSIISHDPTAPEIGYGWALAKFGPMLGHTGELPGYNVFMANDPENHITLVVWANLAPDPTEGKAPATTIARGLLPLIYGGGVDEDQIEAETPGTAP